MPRKRHRESDHRWCKRVVARLSFEGSGLYEARWQRVQKKMNRKTKETKVDILLAIKLVLKRFEWTMNEIIHIIDHVSRNAVKKSEPNWAMFKSGSESWCHYWGSCPHFLYELLPPDTIIVAGNEEVHVEWLIKEVVKKLCHLRFFNFNYCWPHWETWEVCFSVVPFFFWASVKNEEETVIGEQKRRLVNET